MSYLEVFLFLALLSFLKTPLTFVNHKSDLKLLQARLAVAAAKILKYWGKCITGFTFKMDKQYHFFFS